MKPIVVGIDGSQAAITAAVWGIDEAISRAAPLRLVSVIKPTHPHPEDYERDSGMPRHAFGRADPPLKPADSSSRSKPRSAWPGRASPAGGIERRRDDLRRLRRHRALRPLDLGFDSN